MTMRSTYISKMDTALENLKIALRSGNAMAVLYSVAEIRRLDKAKRNPGTAVMRLVGGVGKMEVAR